jgi:4a-hydroxytetrahydrobiopterin dehydratase
MKQLHQQKCVPCEGGTKPLKRGEFEKYLEVTPTWKVINNDLAIQKEFKFKNFKESLEFVNKVGEIAESEGHHPDLNLHDWNKLTITLSTHAISGLSVNDFILASKIDHLLF